MLIMFLKFKEIGWCLIDSFALRRCSKLVMKVLPKAEPAGGAFPKKNYCRKDGGEKNPVDGKRCRQGF